VTPAAARIYTGARWAGFLTIDPLRQVHLAAFRAIARALGSSTMALCADARDDVSDVFLENGSQAECIAQLKSAMGPPETSLDWVTPEVLVRREHGIPSWFLDTNRVDE
jgi:hypothetical protein